MGAKIFDLQLESEKGIETVKVNWENSEDIISISIDLPDKQFFLNGDSTEDVFMKLSELLKDKYKIHSCYTCRYGNFCPVGDLDNEIFCINDFEPKCKEDVYHVTENSKERKQRRRTLFDCCSDFRLHSKDYFTYK